MPRTCSRRDFVTSVSSAAALGAVAPFARPLRLFGAAPKSKVVIVKTSDRKKGVAEVLRLLNVKVPKGKAAVIKPNFNTSDPAPGSTHNDTLRQLIVELMSRDAGSVIAVGSREITV